MTRFFTREKPSLQIFGGPDLQKHRAVFPKTSKCFPKNIEKFFQKHRKVFQKLRAVFRNGLGTILEKSRSEKRQTPQPTVSAAFGRNIRLGGCIFLGPACGQAFQAAGYIPDIQFVPPTSGQRKPMDAFPIPFVKIFLILKFHLKKRILKLSRRKNIRGSLVICLHTLKPVCERIFVHPTCQQVCKVCCTNAAVKGALARPARK